MAAKRLLLNLSKTQAIWLGGRSLRQLATIDILRLSSLFPRKTFSTCVSDLGVMLDPELTFFHHINTISCASFGLFPVLLLTNPLSPLSTQL